MGCSPLFKRHTHKVQSHKTQRQAVGNTIVRGRHGAQGGAGAGGGALDVRLDRVHPRVDDLLNGRLHAWVSEAKEGKKTGEKMRRKGRGGYKDSELVGVAE